MGQLGAWLRRMHSYRWRCFGLDISWDMINRPHFMLDDERRWFAISWGNGYSDPVWSLQIGPRHG